MEKTKKAILILFLFCIALILPVSASNATKFSISELGFTGPQTILVYDGKNLSGTYNTTSDEIPVPENDFLLVIKPELKNQALDQMLPAAMGWITQYWYVLVFFLGGIILMTRRW